MTKDIVLSGPMSVIEHVVYAMRDYAQAAYPKGGSECSQSAYEALMLAAQQVLDSYDDQRQSARLNRRQRGITRAAVKYYVQKIAEEEACSGAQREGCLIKLLSGEVVSGEEYHRAEWEDRSHDI